MPVWDEETKWGASQAATNYCPTGARGRQRAAHLSHTALFNWRSSAMAFKHFSPERIGYPYADLPDIGQLTNYDHYTNSAATRMQRVLSGVSEEPYLSGGKSRWLGRGNADRSRIHKPTASVDSFARCLVIPVSTSSRRFPCRCSLICP